MSLANAIFYIAAAIALSGLGGLVLGLRVAERHHRPVREAFLADRREAIRELVERDA